MAQGATDIGTGTKIVFSTFLTTSNAEVLGINWSGIERAAIDSSHMGTTGGRTFLDGDLYDPGEVVVDLHLNTTSAPPITAAATTLTITFPPNTVTNDTWTASAFMTGFEFTDPLEDKMTATATFKCSGSIGF